MAAIKRTSLFLPLYCFVIWLVSCNTCSDTVKSKVKSTDGQLVANAFERDCGATTDFSSMVNVQNASDKFHPDEGILFIAKGRYDISVMWSAPRILVVTCLNCSRKNIYREVTALGDIDVKYNLAFPQ
ncbi:MAG TPA: hypothetical protein VJO35_18285 [Terriglobales bacterium]|nr:hypothetical protein [Terriglobales bacterium]